MEEDMRKLNIIEDMAEDDDDDDDDDDDECADEGVGLYIQHNLYHTGHT